MDHHEAITMMASERYLLGDLNPELRDAYEEHLFDCPECASDVRSGMMFIDHAKAVLPSMVADMQPAQSIMPIKPAATQKNWFSSFSAWLRPALLVPAFAALLAVIAYQNIVTYPALQTAANEPRLLPWTTLHNATRGGHQVIVADRRQGGALIINVPQDTIYPTYTFDLYDSDGKRVWTKTAASTANPDASWSLWIPGGIFTEGSYKLAIQGVTSGGESVPVEQSTFDLQIQK